MDSTTESTTGNEIFDESQTVTPSAGVFEVDSAAAFAPDEWRAAFYAGVAGGITDEIDDDEFDDSESDDELDDDEFEPLLDDSPQWEAAAAGAAYARDVLEIAPDAIGEWLPRLKLWRDDPEGLPWCWPLAEISEASPDDDEPDDCDHGPYDVPGFVGEVTEFTLRTSYYPNKPLAFAGALALQALLAGRKVALGQTRTNLMIMAAAGSGTGKDAARKTNVEILANVGMLDSIGDEFASGAGLEDALKASPAMLFQADEFDAILRRINSSKDGSQEPLVAMLLKLATGASSKHAVRRKANMPAEFIDQPCLVLLATAVPELLFEQMSTRFLTGGLLARMIVVEAERRGRGQMPEPLIVPHAILDAAKKWASTRGGDGNLADQHPSPIQFELSPRARLVLEGYRNDADDEYARCERKRDVAGQAVWARVTEQLSKLALVYACSENGPDGPRRISARACCWAGAMVFRQAHRMLQLAREHSAETPFEKQCQGVLNRLRKAGGSSPKWKDLRASKLIARDYDAVINTLQQRRQVALAENKGRGGGLTLVLIEK